MKKLLLISLAIVILLLKPAWTFAQPPLGTAKDFVLFTTDGAMKNQNVISQLTGAVGTNNGSNTGFGNVDGVMHTADGATAAAKADLLQADTWLTNVTVTSSHAIGFGGGEILATGVYSVGAASTLGGSLTLNGTSTDIFIFKINGSLSIAGNSEIVLAGGATACNVFWQVNGVISMAVGSKMKGTFISTNAAINMIGVTLEGRALTIVGAITVDGITARIPIGCGTPNPSPVLSGPAAPSLISSQCFVLFSSSGNVTNTVPAAVFTGDIGTNLGFTSGFVNVTGTVHASNDASTAAYVPDLLNSYNYLNLLAKDIDLLFPQQLGNDLVLTPHTYLLSGGTLFTGNLYLNAQGNSNAVFVIQINGALSTYSGAKVILMNSAQAKNVYWKVTGALSIEISSEFKGTIVSNAAVDLKTLVLFEGRALTITGVITTAANSVTIPFVCTPTGITLYNDGNTNDRVTLYPNPSSYSSTILIKDASHINNYELRIYNVRGTEVMNTTITNESTILETGKLSSGIYFYKIIAKNKTIESGKLILQR